jgi:hypothetical protein
MSRFVHQSNPVLLLTAELIASVPPLAQAHTINIHRTKDLDFES